MNREDTTRCAVVPESGLVSAFATSSLGRPPSTGERPTRDTALDFIKGVLVLLMVLYHWLNYFVLVQGLAYRYIRFITPSFVFLAGFLVTNLLASRPGRNSSSLAARLFIRGIKLLALFTVLNLGVAWLEPVRPSGRSVGLAGFIEAFPASYLTGQNTTFFILLPIGYTLMLAALLHKTRDLPPLRFLAPAIVVLTLGASLVLLPGSPTLELIGSGLLGLLVGSALCQRLQHLPCLWPWLTLAYIVHLAALTFWGVPYPLQLVSVCMNLGLLYCLAHRLPPTSATARLMSLLGQYTLLAYVGQIAILQLLFIAFGSVDLGSAEPPVALAAALLLTIAAIAVVDWLRRKSYPVDSLYRLVFA